MLTFFRLINMKKKKEVAKLNVYGLMQVITSSIHRCAQMLHSINTGSINSLHVQHSVFYSHSNWLLYPGVGRVDPGPYDRKTVKELIFSEPVCSKLLEKHRNID